MTELLYTLLAGLLFAFGCFLLMSRHVTRLVAGILLINHAVNLSLLLAGGLERNKVPFLPQGAGTAGETYADPLPQALILTAIVISFALVAFAILVQRRFVETSNSDDVGRHEEEEWEGKPK